LPGGFGIGDLGPAAFKFVDFLARAGQTYWQILPLGPTGYGDSPYQAFSAFAGNTILISPETLAADGLLTNGDLAGKPDFSAGRVDYGLVHGWKKEILSGAFQAFANGAADGLGDEFRLFCKENAFWLDDYALYRAIKGVQHKPWYEWPAGLKLRQPAALAKSADQLAVRVLAEKFYQFLFFRQWLAVKTYANERGVRVIGDLPIFVSLDSSDVWCNRDKFKLNADGSAKFVAGVPPDYFSATGQLWGNPVYDWDSIEADDFSWWSARVEFALRMADIARLDHFIGFVRHWEVPAADETAENGQWVAGPGRKLFEAMTADLGELAVIAEDLGSKTDEVEELRDEFGFPGMRILQYAFGGDGKNRDLPHNYVPNCVAYTGTHDNDTVSGWFASTPRKVRGHCRRYLRFHRGEVHWAMARGVLASVADIAIMPVQDILGLGSEARMNTPATHDGNWQWRLNDGELTDELAARLKEMAELYGR
jgi:4-alpha-glucanotransferase